MSMTVEKWQEARAAAEALVKILKDAQCVTIVAHATDLLEMVKQEEKAAIFWDHEGRMPYYGG